MIPGDSETIKISELPGFKKSLCNLDSVDLVPAFCPLFRRKNTFWAVWFGVRGGRESGGEGLFSCSSKTVTFREEREEREGR